MELMNKDEIILDFQEKHKYKKYHKIIDSLDYFMALILQNNENADVLTVAKFIELIKINYTFDSWKIHEFDLQMLNMFYQVYDVIDPIKDYTPRLKEKYEDLTETIAQTLNTDGSKQQCMPNGEITDIAVKKYLVAILNQSSNYSENSVKTNVMNRDILNDLKAIVESPQVVDLLNKAVLALRPYVYQPKPPCKCGKCNECRKQKFDPEAPYYVTIMKRLDELNKRIDEILRVKGLAVTQITLERIDDNTAKLVSKLSNGTIIISNAFDLPSTRMDKATFERWFETSVREQIITSLPPDIKQTVASSLEWLFLNKASYDDIEIVYQAITQIGELAQQLSDTKENKLDNSNAGVGVEITRDETDKVIISASGQELTAEKIMSFLEPDEFYLTEGKTKIGNGGWGYGTALNDVVTKDTEYPTLTTTNKHLIEAINEVNNKAITSPLDNVLDTERLATGDMFAKYKDKQDDTSWNQASDNALLSKNALLTGNVKQGSVDVIDINSPEKSILKIAGGSGQVTWTNTYGENNDTILQSYPQNDGNFDIFAKDGTTLLAVDRQNNIVNYKGKEIAGKPVWQQVPLVSGDKYPTQDAGLQVPFTKNSTYRFTYNWQKQNVWIALTKEITIPNSPNELPEEQVFLIDSTFMDSHGNNPAPTQKYHLMLIAKHYFNNIRGTTISMLTIDDTGQEQLNFGLILNVEKLVTEEN